MGTLQIHLLGGFELEFDGVPLPPIPQRAARSVLAFLAVNRDRSHTRDLLAGTFWPDLPDARARRRLSQALWRIRATLSHVAVPGRGPVLATRDAVRLNPDADLWLDVERFEHLLREASTARQVNLTGEVDCLEAAVELYRGDLMDGFYDDWLGHDRERLRELLLGALERLTYLTMSRGDYEAALAHARRLARHDPFREETHQRVMRLAVLLGRHSEAIRQYKVCRRILADEIHAQPSPVTNEIFRAAVLERSSPHRLLPTAPSPWLLTHDDQVPLVGREGDRSLISQRLDAALGSHGGLVLVEGEVGIGKTRLLRAIAGDAAWRGMDVLWGAAAERGSRPYAPLADALADGLSPLRTQQLRQRLAPVWQEQVAHLLPSLQTAKAVTQRCGSQLHPSEEQARMQEAMTLTFLTLADISPLVLVLDDMHWADADTVHALTCLAGRVVGHRIVIVLSYRRAEALEQPMVWALLRSLDQQPSCTRISLGPLSQIETESLIRCHLDLSRASSHLVDQVLEETAGVPLLIVELVRGFGEHGHLHKTRSPSPSRPSGDYALVTAEVDALLRSRLTGLSHHARSVLDLLSVHTGHLALAELAAASDLKYSTVLRAVDELARQRLIVEDPTGYRFCHELMRRVVYSHLPKSLRTKLHRTVALAVEDSRPGEAEILASHFATAGMLDRSVFHLERAAEHAVQVSAFDTAAQHLTQAVQAMDTFAGPSEQQFRVSARLEEVLDVLGRRREQGEVLERMQEWASRNQIIDVLRRRAWWLAHQDRFSEAQAEARRAIDLARDADDPGRLVAGLSTLGMIACLAGRAAEGVTYLKQAASFRGADLNQQADARNALGQNLLDLQQFEEAEPQLLAALALYSELHDERGQAEVLGMLGTLRMERGEHDLAERAILRAIEASQLIGYRYGEALYRMNLGILYALIDKPQSAFQEFEKADEAFELIGNRRGQALVLSNAAWLRHAVIGDDAAAERDATQALLVYEEIGDIRGEAQCRATIGSVRYRSGKPNEGHACFQQALGCTRIAKDSWIEAQILKEWARCELEAGFVQQGLGHVEAALRLCVALGMSDLATSAKALQGRLLVDSGKPEEALTATKEALQGLRAGVDSAHLIPFAHGLALAASGRRTEADRYLNLAHDQLLAVLSSLPEPHRQAALASVPGHRAVIDAWMARRPVQTQCQLPRLGAPTNAPLSDHDCVTVTWTISSPDDPSPTEPIARRRRCLRRLMSEAAAQGASPTIPDLAKALGTSVSTTRRDLAFLRSQGHKIATRGNR